MNERALTFFEGRVRFATGVPEMGYNWLGGLSIRAAIFGVADSEYNLTIAMDPAGERGVLRALGAALSRAHSRGAAVPAGTAFAYGCSAGRLLRTCGFAAACASGEHGPGRNRLAGGVDYEAYFVGKVA